MSEFIVFLCFILALAFLTAALGAIARLIWMRIFGDDQ